MKKSILAVILLCICLTILSACETTINTTLSKTPTDTRPVVEYCKLNSSSGISDKSATYIFKCVQKIVYVYNRTFTNEGMEPPTFQQKGSNVKFTYVKDFSVGKDSVQTFIGGDFQFIILQSGRELAKASINDKVTIDFGTGSAVFSKGFKK